MRSYPSHIEIDAETATCLDAFGAVFGRALRSMHASRRGGRALTKPEFMRHVGLASRQYNAARRYGSSVHLAAAAVLVRRGQKSRDRYVSSGLGHSASTCTDGCGFEKARSGRRKAILGGVRYGNAAVRRQAIHSFSRVGVTGANRRQHELGRRHEARNKRLWN
jgi:hypothetical protein